LRLPLTVSLAALLLTAAGAGHAQAQSQMRYQTMDTDHDGVVTRGEWHGTDRAFRNQDWNGDGVLSGDEVRPGAQRQTNWNQDWNHDGIIDQQDTLIAQRYRNFDKNGDGRVATSEWLGKQPLFRRLDINGDGYLTMAEYTNNDGFRPDSQGGPAYSFSNIDKNRDSWITRNEWNMGDAAFNRLDTNRDNRISNLEFQTNSTVNDAAADPQFSTVDRNRDGWITRTESGMTNAEFNNLDTNSDNRLSRFEFDRAADNSSSGYDSDQSAVSGALGRFPSDVQRRL
jgi:Ca2+-binding EF-hand superfamily protein